MSRSDLLRIGASVWRGHTLVAVWTRGAWYEPDPSQSSGQPEASVAPPDRAEVYDDLTEQRPVHPVDAVRAKEPV